jgi:lipoyl(octanoyl) transferase
LKKVKFLDWQTLGYQLAWDHQTVLFNLEVERKIAERQNPNLSTTPKHHLIFVEHPHVYTLGKTGSMDNLLLSEKELEDKSIEFVKTNRGGDITYHGFGQIVGYPILDLEEFFTDIHKYMRSLEEVIILTLDEFGIKGDRYEGYTGVWIEPETDKARKICAMGVKTSRWVTMHGWALNVNTDLSYFKNIVPCGIDDKDVTSMERELGGVVDIKLVKDTLKKKFEEVFDCQLVD